MELEEKREEEKRLDDKGVSLQGLTHVFYKPTAFFTRLKDNPKLLVIYLVLAVLTFAYWWTIKDLFVEEIIKSQAFQERLQGMDLPESAYTLMGIWQAVQSSVFIFVGPLLAALLAWFWGKVLYGRRATFKQLFSVMMYGELIYVVGNLLILPLVLARKSLYVSMSLGVLAPEKSFQSTLFVALSKLDLFLIWEIIVIGIGLAVVFNIPRSRGYLLSVLSMGLLSIIQVVYMAIANQFV